MKSNRLSADERRQLLIKTAVTIADKNGLAKVSHSEVAHHCIMRCSESLVKYYFPTHVDLRRAVCEYITSKSIKKFPKIITECRDMGHCEEKS